MQHCAPHFCESPMKRPHEALCSAGDGGAAPNGSDGPPAPKKPYAPAGPDNTKIGAVHGAAILQWGCECNPELSVEDMAKQGLTRWKLGTVGLLVLISVVESSLVPWDSSISLAWPLQTRTGPSLTTLARRWPHTVAPAGSRQVRSSRARWLLPGAQMHFALPICCISATPIRARPASPLAPPAAIKVLLTAPRPARLRALSRWPTLEG